MFGLTSTNAAFPNSPRFLAAVRDYQASCRGHAVTGWLTWAGGGQPAGPRQERLSSDPGSSGELAFAGGLRCTRAAADTRLTPANKGVTDVEDPLWLDDLSPQP